jgi:hypothetical protein
MLEMLARSIVARPIFGWYLQWHQIVRHRSIVGSLAVAEPCVQPELPIWRFEVVNLGRQPG